MPGLTVWVGFLYIAWKAKRRDWRRFGFVYLVAGLPPAILLSLAPEDADGRTDMGSWQGSMANVLIVILWAVSLVHALLVNREWLRWRARADET